MRLTKRLLDAIVKMADAITASDARFYLGYEVEDTADALDAGIWAREKLHRRRKAAAAKRKEKTK